MHDIDVRRIDLNLLVVLEVLLHERNVTRAARRLGRTQSAVSHALARLRAQLGDPILVRVAGEMRATPRAERLGAEVTRLLRAIGRVLSHDAEPDLSKTDRVFTVCGPDFVAAAMPALVARMSRDAPEAAVELVPAGSGMLRDVAEGRYDVAIAPTRQAALDGLVSSPLGSLEWAVYARAHHPAVVQWGREAWAAHRHVRVRVSSGGESPVDVAARSAGLRRRNGPFLPHFLLVPPLLARTDLLFTVPRAVLADVAPRFGLVALPCPLPLPPIALALHWSAQLDRDPLLSWFRESVRAAVRESWGLDAASDARAKPKRVSLRAAPSRPKRSRVTRV